MGVDARGRLFGSSCESNGSNAGARSRIYSRSCRRGDVAMRAGSLGEFDVDDDDPSLVWVERYGAEGYDSDFAG